MRRPLAGLLFVALLAAFLGASGLEAGATGGTRFAIVLEIAVVVSLVGAAAAALAPAVPALLTVAGGCALALTVAPALAGHAFDPDQPRVLAPLLDAAHTAAAAVWLGGLVAALWLLPRSSLDSWERRAVLRRFSAVAVAAVVLLAATGLGRALTELGGISELWSTSYGRALLLKTALFVPLLAVGRLSRSLLEDRSPRLARSIGVEVAAITAIVVVVAVLTQLRPGSDAPKRRTVGFTMPVRLTVDRFEKARSVLERREP
jgi:copper transport protein